MIILTVCKDTRRQPFPHTGSVILESLSLGIVVSVIVAVADQYNVRYRMSGSWCHLSLVLQRWMLDPSLAKIKALSCDFFQLGIRESNRQPLSDGEAIRGEHRRSW